MKKTMTICITALIGAGLLGISIPAYADPPPPVCGSPGFTEPCVSPHMRKWVDSLPVPPPAETKFIPWISRTSDYYEINMTASQHKFHRDLGPATVWTYGQPGKAPVLLGPTIVAKTGRPVIVKYINNLPTDPNVFPMKDAIDETIDGWDVPTGAAIPHLHGGHTAARFDGTPMQWWTADGIRGDDYKTDTFTYLNDQPASLLWYHDHTMGSTRFKPYIGLAAAYLVVDDVDNGETITVDGPKKNGKVTKIVQKVPSGYGQYHLPIVLQDKQFNENGTLFYPTEGISAVHPVWVPEFFGDTPVINGKAYPYLNAEARRYRLRFLNGSQATFYNVGFKKANGKFLKFYVIGSEGGLLPAPVETTQLLIAPGERFDVIVDFAGLSGKTIMMTNDANAPYPDGDPTLVPELMKINVGPSAGPDDTVPPASLILPAVPRLSPTRGIPPRDVVLKENADEFDNPVEVLLNGYHFLDRTNVDKIKNGTTEIWQWINLTVDAHPMHMHLVTFQVVDRQAFDVDGYTADWQAYLDSGRKPRKKPDVFHYLTGDPIGPAPEEMGFKDTVKAYPGYVTRVIAKFTLPATSLLDYDWRDKNFGSWVYHCHILEHEENDMMRPFQVVP